MYDENQQFKRLIKLFAGLAALLLAWMLLMWLYHMLTFATLTVRSDNSAAYVVIAPMKNGQPGSPIINQTKHSLTRKVSPGTYQISANVNHFSTSRVVSIKSRQSLSFTLNPVIAVSPEPVYGNSVSGVVADNSRVNFIDFDDRTGNTVLSSLDASNMVTELYSKTPLSEAKWANTSLGLARDSSNNLYLIQDGHVSQVSLPISIPQNDAFMSYDITQDGQIYVSQGTDIYKGSLSGGFRKIYTSKSVVFGLSAGQGDVSAVESSDKTAQDPGGSLLVVKDSGQSQRKDVDARQAGQSPDGKYIVVLLDNDTGLAIYASSSMKQVASLPSTSTSSFGWGVDDNLFYNQSESLWVYGANSHQSDKLAVAPGKAHIIGISPTPDGSYIYLTTVSTNPDADSGASQLFRVGLKNQPSNSAIQGLSVFLPTSLNEGANGYCSLNYVNFSAPTISVHYPGNYSAAAESYCLGLTQGDIEQYGLSPGDYQYKFFPDSDE